MSISNLKANKWSKTSPISDLDKIRIECGVDEDFRNRFLADPAGVLQAYGIDIPAGLRINVHQDTATEYNINIPPYRGNDLSSTSLQSASADNGTTWCTTCTATTPICFGSLASLICLINK